MGEGSKEKEEKSADSGEMPTLGIDDRSYQGFQYLEAHKLDTGEEKAIVYVPVSDYVYEYAGEVSSDKLGVTVDIELNSFIQFDQEEFTMEENLQKYTENHYDFDEFYTTERKDMEIYEINAISKEAEQAEEDAALRILEMYMPEDVENVKCEVIGDTTVGYALKSSFEAAEQIIHTAKTK